MNHNRELGGCEFPTDKNSENHEKFEEQGKFDINIVITNIIEHFVEIYKTDIINDILKKSNADGDYQTVENRIKCRIYGNEWQKKMRGQSHGYTLICVSEIANWCVKMLHLLCKDPTNLLKPGFKQRYNLESYPPEMNMIKTRKYKNALPRLLTKNFSNYLETQELDPSNIAEVFSILLDMDDIATLCEYEPLIQYNVKLKRKSRLEYSIQFNAGTSKNIKDMISEHHEVVVMPINKVLKNPQNCEMVEKSLYVPTTNDIIADISVITNTGVSFIFQRSYEINWEDTSINVIFRPLRYTIRYQHRAIQLLGSNLSMKNYLFPHDNSDEILKKENWAQDNVLKLINPTIATNPEQLEAVHSITSGINLIAPYIIFGPPGTGKTTTIVESILQLRLQYSESRILVTAGSNSACDVVALRLCKYFISDSKFFKLDDAEILPLIRVYSKSSLNNKIENIPNDLVNCSNIIWNRGQYAFPAVEDIQKYGIVVTTLCTVGKLVCGGMGANDYFTHIFIDECAASTEPEALVGIMGIKNKKDGNCQVILSGDHKQLGAVLKSEIASKLGLGQSLMERLLKRPCYALDDNGNYDHTLQVHLRRNYRSHPEIVELYNTLYYNNKLLPLVDINTNRNWSFLPNSKFPVIFQAVYGSTAHNDTTSTCNFVEINVLKRYVERLVKDDNVRQEDIGIIAPYRLQCQYIKSRLKASKWPNIEIGCVENFQGREKEIILISMVRSFTSMGFLKNERRLNVMLSRAKSLLIILGNPSTLCHLQSINYIINKCKSNGTYLCKTKEKSRKNRRK